MCTRSPYKETSTNTPYFIEVTPGTQRTEAGTRGRLEGGFGVWGLGFRV